MPRSRGSVEFRRVLAELKRNGLLLESDSEFPSVAGVIVGGRARGSWWAHPKGHVIHYVTTKLQSHPDVLCLRLVKGKVTYAHRKLWPAIFALATANQPWQRERLSTEARWLLRLVRRKRVLRIDQLKDSSRFESRRIAEAAVELERRLLVHGIDVHTERGAHAKILETWSNWAARVKFARKHKS